jgi:hypothetical protein
MGRDRDKVMSESFLLSDNTVSVVDRSVYLGRTIQFRKSHRWLHLTRTSNAMKSMGNLINLLRSATASVCIDVCKKVGVPSLTYGTESGLPHPDEVDEGVARLLRFSLNCKQLRMFDLWRHHHLQPI